MNVPVDGAPVAGTSANGSLPRQSVGRNAFHMVSSQAVTSVLSLVLSIIVPRFLGPAGGGQLRLAYSIWLIAEVFVSFGTSTLLTLEIAKDRTKGMAMVGPVLAMRAFGFVFAWIGVMAFAVLSGSSTTTIVVIVIGGVSSMFASLAGIGRAALYGLEQMSYPSLADTVTKVCTVVAVVTVLLVFGGNVFAVIGASTLMVGLNAWMMIAFLRRSQEIRLWGSWAETRPLWRMARAMMIGEAAIIVYISVDSVVISLLVDETVLGWYAAADGLFSSLLFVPVILMTTLFPVIGRLHAEDPARMKHLIGQAFGSLLLIGVPVGLGTVAVGPQVALLLYGEEFREAGPVLAVLGIVTVLIYQTILLGRYAIATGRQQLWNVLMIGGIAMTIVLDIVLVPWADDRFGNGAIGGALSYVVTESCMLVVGLVTLGRGMFDSSIIIRSVKIVGAGLVMLGAVWPLRDRFLAIPVLVGFVVYGTLILILSALDEFEKDAIRKMSRRVLRGR